MSNNQRSEFHIGYQNYKNRYFDKNTQNDNFKKNRSQKQIPRNSSLPLVSNQHLPCKDQGFEIQQNQIRYQSSEEERQNQNKQSASKQQKQMQKLNINNEKYQLNSLENQLDGAIISSEYIKKANITKDQTAEKSNFKQSFPIKKFQENKKKVSETPQSLPSVSNSFQSFSPNSPKSQNQPKRSLQNISPPKAYISNLTKPSFNQHSYEYIIQPTYTNTKTFYNDTLRNQNNLSSIVTSDKQNRSSKFIKIQNRQTSFAKNESLNKSPSLASRLSPQLQQSVEQLNKKPQNQEAKANNQEDNFPQINKQHYFLLNQQKNLSQFNEQKYKQLISEEGLKQIKTFKSYQHIPYYKKYIEYQPQIIYVPMQKVIEKNYIVQKIVDYVPIQEEYIQGYDLLPRQVISHKLEYQLVQKKIVHLPKDTFLHSYSPHRQSKSFSKSKIKDFQGLGEEEKIRQNMRRKIKRRIDRHTKVQQRFNFNLNEQTKTKLQANSPIYFSPHHYSPSRFSNQFSNQTTTFLNDTLNPNQNYQKKEQNFINKDSFDDQNKQILYRKRQQFTACCFPKSQDEQISLNHSQRKKSKNKGLFTSNYPNKFEKNQNLNNYNKNSQQFSQRVNRDQKLIFPHFFKHNQFFHQQNLNNPIKQQAFKCSTPPMISQFHASSSYPTSFDTYQRAPANNNFFIQKHQNLKNALTNSNFNSSLSSRASNPHLNSNIPQNLNPHNSPNITSRNNDFKQTSFNQYSHHLQRAEEYKRLTNNKNQLENKRKYKKTYHVTSKRKDSDEQKY